MTTAALLAVTLVLGIQAQPKLEKSPQDLSMDQRFFEIDDRVPDRFRVQFKWGRLIMPGGGKGWMTGAEPLGVKIYFSSIAGSRPGFLLTHISSTNPDKLSRWSAEHFQLTWARTHFDHRFVHIQRWFDMAGGKTVQQIHDEVVTFAKRIKALDLS